MVNKKIQLDFTEEGLREKIEVVQGDTGRVLVCNIIGVDMTNVSARFYAVKKSGKEIYNNCTVSQNTVTIELTEQTLAEVGIVKCQLDLRKGDQKVQSFIFDIDVTASLMAQSEYLSSDEYKVVDDLVDKVEKNENKIAELDDKKANKDDYGSPLKAKTVAEMTDKKKVYVYVGTETGYINGNWYTWEETAWVSGGVYNSAAIQTDKTLTQSDKAADSAIVGQQIGALKESLKDINVETDKTLTQSGKPADAEVVGKNLDDLKKNNDNLVENVPTGTCTDVIVMDLTDKSNYIQGKFVNNIPTPDTSGNEYFTDYIDCTTDDFLRIPDIVVTRATAYRLFDDSKAFLGLYWGVPRDVLKTAVKTKNENAKYIVISYDTLITTGHLTKTVYETYGKSKIAGKEFDYYGVQNTRISFVVSYNGEISKKYSCVPGETYTFRASSNCNVYFYNPAKVIVEMKSISSKNNIEVAIEVTAPETAVYFALGGQNMTSCSLEGNFYVERCTAPKLQLTKNNFNQESFEAIAEGLGISSGKNPTELYYNCTNYGVVPGSSDNTAKFQELVDLVYEAGGGTIWIPCGTYVFDTELSSVDLTGYITALVEMKSGVSLLGESLTGTVLKVIGQTKDGCGLFCQNSVHSGEVLSGCNAQNFTVDMSEASLTNYTHRGKAFYYSGIKDSVFRDLRLLETPSTSMGIDMLDNVVLDSIYVYKGGKQWTYGGNGGAGIGIGTGKWKNENYIIRNCICDSCGHFGIFLEDQGIFNPAKDRTYSKGQIICNNVVRNGRHYGLGIRGGQNVLITGNNLYENKGGIYADYGAKNVMVSNNLIQGSTEAGFNYGNESTDYVCENMAIINNTFVDNSVGIKKTLTPTNCTENGNVFINNTTNTQ